MTAVDVLGRVGERADGTVCSVDAVTGAGDTFAGGFMGYLAQQDATDPTSLRRAMVRGAAMASFTVEDFSLERLKRLERREIEERLLAFAEMVRLEG